MSSDPRTPHLAVAANGRPDPGDRVSIYQPPARLALTGRENVRLLRFRRLALPAAPVNGSRQSTGLTSQRALPTFKTELFHPPADILPTVPSIDRPSIDRPSIDRARVRPPRYDAVRVPRYERFHAIAWKFVFSALDSSFTPRCAAFQATRTTRFLLHQQSPQPFRVNPHHPCKAWWHRDTCQITHQREGNSVRVVGRLDGPQPRPQFGLAVATPTSRPSCKRSRGSRNRV